jgi:hypothetical protein
MNNIARVRRQRTTRDIYKVILILRQRRKTHIVVGLDQEWVVAGVVMVENRGMWCDGKNECKARFSFFLTVSILDVCRKHFKSERTLADESLTRGGISQLSDSVRSRGSMLGYTCVVLSNFDARESETNLELRG